MNTKQLILYNIYLNFTTNIHYNYLNKLITSQITNFPKKTYIKPIPTTHYSITYTTHFIKNTITYQYHNNYHFKNPNHPTTLIYLNQPTFTI